MNLPKGDALEIAREKITEYLLNPLYPDGASEAAFFAALGFTSEKWEELAHALRLLARDCPVAKTADTVHGTKYVVDEEIDHVERTRASCAVDPRYGRGP